MKERIVNDYGAEIKNICRGCAEGVKQKCKQTQKEHLQCALNYSERKDFKVEQVPETFEELKELCRNSKIPKCYFAQDLFIKTKEPLTYYEYICVDGVLFLEDGYIYAGYENDNISTGRTPAQMWAIIKSLV